jgi:membrane-associated protein
LDYRRQEERRSRRHRRPQRVDPPGACPHTATIRTDHQPGASFYWPVRIDLQAGDQLERSRISDRRPPSVGPVADVLAWLTQQPTTQIYLISGLLLAAEVGLLAGLAVPAASIMLTLGAMANGGQLRLATVIAVAVGAGIVGDSLAYWEGRLFGPRLRAGWLGRCIGVKRWQRAELMFRRGAPAIAVGRWTSFVRTLVPRIAGAAGISYRTFLAYEMPAVLIWMPGTILVGYAVGAALQ